MSIYLLISLLLWDGGDRHFWCIPYPKMHLMHMFPMSIYPYSHTVSLSHLIDSLPCPIDSLPHPIDSPPRLIDSPPRLRTKIEHISLNSCPFEAVFSRIGYGLCFLGAGILYIFYFTHFRVHTFLFC